MSDLYTDLTNERNALLHELNAERAKSVTLGAMLDKSETARYALMSEVVELRRQLAQLAQLASAPQGTFRMWDTRLTLTDRGDAADGYHPGEVEP